MKGCKPVGNRTLAGDQRLDGKPQHGHHRKAAVLDLLDLCVAAEK